MSKISKFPSKDERLERLVAEVFETMLVGCTDSIKERMKVKCADDIRKLLTHPGITYRFKLENIVSSDDFKQISKTLYQAVKDSFAQKQMEFAVKIMRLNLTICKLEDEVMRIA